MLSMRPLCALQPIKWREGYYLGRSLVFYTSKQVRSVAVARQKSCRTQHTAAAAGHAVPGTFISPWQPLTIPEPLVRDAAPAAESLNILVVESFAGSYSAARAARLLNFIPSSIGMPAVRCSAYAAIELDKRCYRKGPDSLALGISDPSRFLSINGSVIDPAVQGRILNFVQHMLQQSEEANAAAATSTTSSSSSSSSSSSLTSQQQQQQHLRQRRLDGILFVGGPPCTFYSLANNGNARGIARQPDLYKLRLFQSDQIVQAFLAMYTACKALAASSSSAAASAAAGGACPRPVATCIVMENPWSADLLRIKYPQEGSGRGRPPKLQPAAAAAAVGLVEAAAAADVSPEAADASAGSSNAGGVREHVPWGLRARRFLAHELQKNGGPLAVTHHNWCSYGHMSHPWKSTAIFSDLPSLSDARCICNKCQPTGRRVGGRQKHAVTVEGQRNSSARAVWPDGFMLRVAWLFGAAMKR